MISLTDVTMPYGDLTVLGPVTLDIPAGGVTALVGPNGRSSRVDTSTSSRVVSVNAPLSRWSSPRTPITSCSTSR